MRQKSWVPDRFLLISVVGLLVIGFITLYSIYMAQSHIGNISSIWSELSTYFIGLIIGLSCAFLVYRSTPKLYRSMSYPIYILAVVMLLFVFVPSIGSTGEHKRWLDFAVVSFQPSEFAKLAVILLTANYLTERDAKTMSLREIIILMVMIAVIGGLIVMESSLSAAIMIMIIFVLQYYLSGAKVWVLFVLFGLFSVAVFIQSIVDIDMWKSRFKGVFDPIGTVQNEGYQLFHSLVAVASGGFFGRGLFSGVQKFNNSIFSLEADFIFANIAEEFGFLGSLIVIVLYFMFVVGAIKIAGRSKNQFAYLVALGIALHIGMQAFFNIGIAIGLLPVTGATLPFISAGSSSLIINLVEVGILFGIDRNSFERKKKTMLLKGEI
ncbi:MAG: FtsW/RodA/SpoVE family cell cycle protein [Caldisericia bacterium]